MTQEYIGASIRRREDSRLRHAAILRSPHAHADLSTLAKLARPGSPYAPATPAWTSLPILPVISLLTATALMPCMSRWMRKPV